MPKYFQVNTVKDKKIFSYNFIGIDIGKDSFVVASHGSKKTTAYENSAVGIHEFI